MSAHLIACPACFRHVRASEGSCPFCMQEVHATPEPLGPAVRLSRAALHAFSVGTLAVATACSSSSSSPMQTPPYGGVVFTDGYAVGESCTGKDYVESSAGQGYLFCSDGEWAYTTQDPADAGYTLVADGDAGDDASDDSASDATDDADDSGVPDATTDAHD